MTLGLFEKFPALIHFSETFSSALPTKQLQQRLIRIFYEVNKLEFSFEEAANPTIPNCKVIFEFGIADGKAFNYMDGEELEKALYLLEKEQLDSIDFLCSIRYYKILGDKKTALKFDYYFIRTMYGDNSFEIDVAHEKGPRYISPEDLTTFISKKVNEGVRTKILTQVIDGLI